MELGRSTKIMQKRKKIIQILHFYQYLTGKSCLLYVRYKLIVLQRTLFKLRTLRKEE